MSVILLLHTILMALTFGNFELLTVDYHSIDTSIAELNNHTLREVFDGGALAINGDFSNGTTGWTPNFVTINVNNNELINTITSIGSANGVYRTIPNVVIGNTYYFKSDVYVKYNNNINLRLGGQNQYILPVITNSWVTLSVKTTAITTEPPLIYHWTTPNYIIGDTFKYRNILVINQTSLGISALTVSQMDYWFSVYQSNIGADDVTYTVNEHDMTDLIILLGFGFSWIGIFWILRKVVS